MFVPMDVVEVDAASDEGEKRDCHRPTAPWLVNVRLVGVATHLGPDYVVHSQPDERDLGCALLGTTLGLKSFF